MAFFIRTSDITKPGEPFKKNPASCLVDAMSQAEETSRANHLLLVAVIGKNDREYARFYKGSEV